MGTDPTIIAWLVGLSLSLLAVLGGVVALWFKLNNLPSIRELSLNDKMDRILNIASQSTALKNEAIRRAVVILIESIEKDPLAKERFWVQVEALRNAVTA